MRGRLLGFDPEIIEAEGSGFDALDGDVVVAGIEVGGVEVDVEVTWDIGGAEWYGLGVTDGEGFSVEEDADGWSVGAMDGDEVDGGTAGFFGGEVEGELGGFFGKPLEDLELCGEVEGYGLDFAGGSLWEELFGEEDAGVGGAAEGLGLSFWEGWDDEVCGHEGAVVVEGIGAGVEIGDASIGEVWGAVVVPEFEEGSERLLEGDGVEDLEAVVGDVAGGIGSGVEGLSAVGVSEEVGSAPGVVEVVFGACAEGGGGGFAIDEEFFIAFAPPVTAGGGYAGGVHDHGGAAYEDAFADE